MCILMVDDETLILEIMAETFYDAGYDVVTASDGGQALAILEQRRDHISALVSDFQLPQGVTGIDVARAARRRRPDLPVIIATGRPDVLNAHGPPLECFVLIVKPYLPSEMIAAIGRMVPPHRAGAGAGAGQNDFSKRSM